MDTEFQYEIPGDLRSQYEVDELYYITPTIQGQAQMAAAVQASNEGKSVAVVWIDPDKYRVEVIS